MYTANDYASKKAEAQNKLNAYIDKVNAEKPAANEIAGAKEALDAAVAAYNALVISDAYEALFTQGDDTLASIATDPAAHLKATDPIRKAIDAYRFAGLMKASIKRDKDTGRIAAGKTSLTCVSDDDVADKKTVYRLREIEAKWVELQEAAGVAQKVSLTASPEWSSLVYRMKRLFTARSLAQGGYTIPSNVTADYIVYMPDGTSVAVADLTDEQKAKLDTKTSVKALKGELQALVDAVYFDSTGRKDGGNQFRVVEKDVHWVEDNAHRFDDRKHKTLMMTDATAFELTFCIVAHVVTGKPYDAICE